MNRFLLGIIVGAAATWGPGAVMAQAVAPGSIDPGRIQQQFQPPKPAPAKPEIVTPEISDNVPPDSAARTRITLSAIEVDGSSVYATSDFLPLIKPLLGHEIRLLDVFTLADQITARYRNDDYILSRAVIPAQKIENGVMHVRVVEGYVHAVTIRGPHNALLEKYGAEIAASHPLRRKVLERYLLLMNAMPGVTARAVLEPATGVTGGTDLTVVATQKTVDGYLTADNRGSRYLGPLEGYAGVGFNNIFGLGERTSIDYGTAYPNADGHNRELSYFDGREDVPLGDDGLLLTVTGARSKADPGFTLKALDTHTTGTSFSTMLSYPIISSRASTWTVHSTFSFLNATADINDEPDEVPSYNDRIRALRVGTSYDFADQFGGHNLVNAELSEGLPIFGASESGSLDVSRPGASSDFHKLTIDLSRRQELDRVLPNLGVYAAVTAQTSFGDPLLSAEQFGVGGATFGRGYEPSELTGDKGIAAKVELQYNQQLKPITSELQYYGFYDVGVVGDVLADVGVPSSQSLASAGGGVRYDLPYGFSGLFEVAKPLTKPVETELIRGSSDPKRANAYFAITKRF
jgi:hemolysin activation/secretion protein